MPAVGRPYRKQTIGEVIPVDSTGIVIPPHDCEVIAYDAQNDPTSITYREDDYTQNPPLVGENGKIVAVVTFTYDGNKNPTIIKRTA